jgi:hypothetical protein
MARSSRSRSRPGWTTARALVRGAGSASVRLSCCRWSPASSVVERILRSCAAGSQRVTMHRADPTTRRPSRAPYPSPRDDLASGRPDVGGGDRDRRGRYVHPHGLARGSRRWAIRWAKPRRIGPYQARRKTPAGSQLLRLQVFSRVKGATNAMLHHARGLWFETTRGPSQKGAISRHFAGKYRGLRPAKLGPRVLARPACCAPEFAWPPRTAHERICRTAPCLTRERSPVRTQPRPSSSEGWHRPRFTVLRR